MKEIEVDYEKIHKKPLHHRQQQQQQGSGLSPWKLRSMLMGIEKKSKQGKQQGEVEGEELDCAFSLKSQGVSCLENCKDLIVASVLPQHLNSTGADSLAMEMPTEHTLKDHIFLNSRIKSQADNFLDDSGIDSITAPTSLLEFQMAEQSLQRAGLPPFSKPLPSKWDDAQKWIASPTSNRIKNGQAGFGSRKNYQFGYGSRQASMKVVQEIVDPTSVPYEESNTKRMELSHEHKETRLPKFVKWDSDPYPSTDTYNSTLMTFENCVKEASITLNQQDSSMSIHSTTTTPFIPPPSTAGSVSMRNMGTEMTPVASQEPSRTGTPVRATTPIYSPASSQPSTPKRILSPYHPNTSTPIKTELSDKEIQIKTRREIMLLGTQLGKMNIAAWASQGEEYCKGQEPPPKSSFETRAAAWEEAEKAKCIARFNQEEIKIHAWEIHEKAKNEAEMRKIEVEIEKMSSRAHDKLMKKLVAVRLKAEEKRRAAESERNRQAAKTEKQADYVRRTGQIPSSFSCCGWWHT